MSNPTVNLRSVTPSDAQACAKIVFDAFTGIATQHNFPVDFPSFDTVTHFLGGMIQHPKFFGVVAEIDGKIVGCNFLDERDDIRGVGPITVDPSVQCKGVGRKLMEAVIERGRGARGIRLLQEAYNRTSMSLYTSLGFDIKEPIVAIMGKPDGKLSAGAEVRPMTVEHLDDCAALCRKVYGVERTGELRDCIAQMKPFVLLRHGKLAAYCSAANLYLLNHGVALDERDIFNLLVGAGNALQRPIGILLPTRQGNLFRWCLSQGMRILKPFSLMSMGEYQDPRGCWFSSINY
jgi:predicted N-acetyltransferase YhbS